MHTSTLDITICPTKLFAALGIYEYRSYTLKPGVLAQWSHRFQQGIHARMLYSKPLGVWFSEIGPLNAGLIAKRLTSFSVCTEQYCLCDSSSHMALQWSWSSYGSKEPSTGRWAMARNRSLRVMTGLVLCFYFSYNVVRDGSVFLTTMMSRIIRPTPHSNWKWASQCVFYFIDLYNQLDNV